MFRSTVIRKMFMWSGLIVEVSLEAFLSEACLFRGFSEVVSRLSCSYCWKQFQLFFLNVKWASPKQPSCRLRLGASPSGRFPQVLKLAQNLNATKVAASWWQRADDDLATFVAAALSELPRFVEFAAEFFKEQPQEKRLNHTEVKGVFERVRKRLQERYFPDLPKADALYPAIFGEQTERNDKVLSLIKNSIFVNSLTNMRQGDKPMIKPVPSLFMLSAAAANSELGGDHFVQLVAKFPGDIELTYEGRPLEWCLRWWMQMRLAAAAGKQNFPLAKLLGVAGVIFADDSDSTMLKKLKKVLFTVPSDADNVRTTFRSGSLASSRKNKSQFLEQMGLLGSDMDSIWLLDAPRGEAWDTMLAVFDTEAGQWFLVFLELKARENQLPTLKQADHVHRLVEKAKQKESSAGLVEALREGRYCFLYITTAQGQSEARSSAIVLKEEDAARFFGPLAAVQKAIRQAFPWGPKPNTAVWRAGKGSGLRALNSWMSSITDAPNTLQ